MNQGQRHRATSLRLAGALALCAIGAIGASVFEIPGDGEFVPAAWLAGFAAAMIAPGWHGFAALLGGAAITSALADLADGAFGLLGLVVAIVCTLAVHGALAGSVLSRFRRLGRSRGLRDARLVLGGSRLIATVTLAAWFAVQFGQKPA